MGAVPALTKPVRMGRCQVEKQQEKYFSHRVGMSKVIKRKSTKSMVSGHRVAAREIQCA